MEGPSNQATVLRGLAQARAAGPAMFRAYLSAYRQEIGAMTRQGGAALTVERDGLRPDRRVAVVRQEHWCKATASWVDEMAPKALAPILRLYLVNPPPGTNKAATRHRAATVAALMGHMPVRRMESMGVHDFADTLRDYDDTAAKMLAPRVADRKIPPPVPGAVAARAIPKADTRRWSTPCPSPGAPKPVVPEDVVKAESAPVICEAVVEQEPQPVQDMSLHGLPIVQVIMALFGGGLGTDYVDDIKRARAAGIEVYFDDERTAADQWNIDEAKRHMERVILSAGKGYAVPLGFATEDRVRELLTRTDQAAPTRTRAVTQAQWHALLNAVHDVSSGDVRGMGQALQALQRAVDGDPSLGKGSPEDTITMMGEMLAAVRPHMGSVAMRSSAGADKRSNLLHYMDVRNTLRERCTA